MSNSLRPHGLYSPWNSLSQNTGVSRLSLLRGIFPAQGSNAGLLHCRQILYQLSSLALDYSVAISQIYGKSPTTQHSCPKGSLHALLIIQNLDARKTYLEVDMKINWSSIYQGKRQFKQNLPPLFIFINIQIKHRDQCVCYRKEMAGKLILLAGRVF